MHDFRTEPNTSVVPTNTRVAKTYDAIQQSAIARNQNSIKRKNKIFIERYEKGIQEKDNRGKRNKRPVSFTDKQILCLFSYPQKRK